MRDVAIISQISSDLMVKMAQRVQYVGREHELPHLSIEMAKDWLRRMRVLEAEVEGKGVIPQ
jgi:hypothetical protein